MSIILGDYNNLEIVKRVDFGVYLDGGADGEILLPARYVPEGHEVGDVVKVFIYLDNEERLVATTETPLAKVGDFAYLKVAWINKYGAFLDWGLMKDLFVPFHEQTGRMEVGTWHLVYVTVDKVSRRLFASERLDRYTSKGNPPYGTGDEVDITVWRRTDLGWKVIVDNCYQGLVYGNEIFRPISAGDKMRAIVKAVRPDGKIDITLQRTGKANDDDASDKLLAMLEDNGGHLAVCDKTPPEEIYAMLGMSKKTFKRAAGKLYKERRITITDDGLTLTKQGKNN